MKYSLALELKEAGFPQNIRIGKGGVIFDEDYKVTGKFDEIFPKAYVPTLEELIKECGDKTKNTPWGKDAGHFEFCLQFSEDKWIAGYTDPSYHEGWEESEEGKTPLVAVAKLYIKLNEAREKNNN